VQHHRFKTNYVSVTTCNAFYSYINSDKKTKDSISFYLHISVNQVHVSITHKETKKVSNKKILLTHLDAYASVHMPVSG